MDSLAPTFNIEFDEEKHLYKVNNKKVPSVTEICSILTNKKYDINPSLLRQAQLRGTLVHELTETIDMGYAIDDAEIYVELEGYIEAYKKFINDYQPEWIYSEKQLTNGVFAGTLDRYGIVDGNEVIVDIKTTSNPDRLSKLAVGCQLAGYYLLLRELNKKPNLEKSFAVYLKKDGTYNVLMYDDIKCDEGYKPYTIFTMMLEIFKQIYGGKK